MKALGLALLLALTISPLSTEAADPINNLENVVVPFKIDGKPLNLEEVRAGIIAGCLVRNWTPIVEEEGVIRASLNHRNKHFAEVRIPFTETHYSIIYLSSENLGYNEKRQRIHRNYNGWVIRLSNSIGQKLRHAGRMLDN